MILQNEESESDAYQRKNDCEDWEKLECLLEEDFSCGSHAGRRVWQNAAAATQDFCRVEDGEIGSGFLMSRFRA